MRMKNGLFREIFSDEIVNDGRQTELDMAKAVLIFCLALVHCTIECTPEEQLIGGIPFWFDSVIGGPLGAPMFMFAMGVGMVYTKQHTPGDYARRGIGIGIIGYALNLCRFFFPFLAGYLLTHDYEKYIVPLPYRVLGNDILQFACLAMLLIALFVRLHMSYRAIFLLCLGMSLLGTCFNGTDVGNPLGNILLGYLIGTEDAQGMVVSDFPVLNWMIFPVSGYIFGQYLLHVKNKGLFYITVSSAGALIAAAYFPTGIKNGWGMFGEGQNCFYHMTTPDALVSLSAAIGILGIYYAAARYIPGHAMNCIREISCNINSIYCIHWVLVTVSTNVILYALRGTQELSVTITMLLGTGISFTAILIAHFWSGRWRSLREEWHEKT